MNDREKSEQQEQRADAYANSVNKHPVVIGYRRAWKWVPPRDGVEPKRYYQELADYLRALPNAGHAALTEAKRRLASQLGCAEHEAARWILTERGPILAAARFDLTLAGEIIWRGLESLSPEDAKRFQLRVRKELRVRTGRGAGKGTVEDVAAGRPQTGKNARREAKRKMDMLLRPVVAPAVVAAYRLEAERAAGGMVTARVNRALALEIAPRDLAALAPLIPSAPPRGVVWRVNRERVEKLLDRPRRRRQPAPVAPKSSAPVKTPTRSTVEAGSRLASANGRTRRRVAGARSTK